MGPLLSHGVEYLATGLALLELQVRRRISLVAAEGVEVAGVRVVPEHVAEAVALPCPDLVARPVAHDGKDVGANIPAAQGGEVPVGLDGSNLGVVVVEAVVGGADELLGDGVAHEDGEDVVLQRIRLVLVPGDEHQRVVHELVVIQKGLEERARPRTGDGGRGVVAVRGHVGRDEHPLRQLVRLEVLVEHGPRRVDHGEVLDLRQPSLQMSDAVV